MTLWLVAVEANGVTRDHSAALDYHYHGGGGDVRRLR